MTHYSVRIPPVSSDKFTAEQKELVGDGWWKDLHYCQVLMQHPALYQVFNPLIAKVISDTNLPPRDRQILVLRTLGLCDEVYEKTHHEHISHNAGLSDSDIAAAESGGSGLAPFEQTLMKAAEELVRDQRISDTTWDSLAQRYSKEQLMEVVGLVGAYTAMAMIMKTFGIPLETPEELARLQALRHYT